MVKEDPGERCVETRLLVVLLLAERMQGGGKCIRERAELEMSKGYAKIYIEKTRGRTIPLGGPHQPLNRETFACVRRL